MAALLEQALEPPIDELMELYARAWRDLGRWVGARGSFLGSLEASGGQAGALVEALLEMPLYRDVCHYDELEVPFLKRAQISVADLASALPGRVHGTRQLTIFADNLIPHVLRIDGVLECDPALIARIERGELLAHGSHEEIELRACALHATERLVEQLAVAGLETSAGQLDQWLWRRGAGAEYKAHPRHRTRCTFY
jgi:hypothetical protein